ncbi:hypothetical protein BYT27DRAFT_7180771 [Phlegmacium glaucopus]|nr:hypothetical protein BYT27DRAFT_7180771 [Phlegmacium glaucopus]
MGGFMLCKDGVMTENLKIRKLETLVAQMKIDWPTISEKDIQDRSKGDSFSKGFAVLQTAWFISQCIARGVAGLILTELEVATLGFSVLNAILYFFWWNKPLDVSCPVAIHLHHTTSSTALWSSDREDRMPATEYRETRDQDTSSLYSDSSYLLAWCPVCEMPTDLQRREPHDQNISSLYSDIVYVPTLHTACTMPTTDLQCHPTTSDITLPSSKQVAGMPTTGVEHRRTSSSDQDTHGHKDGFAISTPFQRNPSAFARFRAYICKELKNKGLFALIVTFIQKPFKIVLVPFISMSFDLPYRHPDPLSVPTFYAPFTSRDDCARLIGIGIGILFGGIHCIAWSFRFLSVAEEYIWRINAVNITVLPPIIIILSVILAYGIRYHSLIFSMAAYLLSRAVLLILPLIALRSLPPEALLDLKWTAFIPHI